MAILTREEQKFYAEYYKEKYDINIEIYGTKDMLEEEAYASHRKELSGYNAQKEKEEKIADEEHGENIDTIIQEIKQFRALLPDFKKLPENKGKEGFIVLRSEALKKPKTLTTYNKYINDIEQSYAGKYRSFIAIVKPKEGSEDFDGFKKNILNFIALKTLTNKGILPPTIDMDAQNATNNNLLLDKIKKTQQDLKEGETCSLLFNPLCYSY